LLIPGSSYDPGEWQVAGPVFHTPFTRQELPVLSMLPGNSRVSVFSH
jgi:hypothetical protein